MKIIKFFILLLFFTNCSEKKSENNQTEFHKILGEENCNTLNYLISDFENDFLKRNYPNLNIEKAYRQFLTDLKDEKIDFWWNQISKKSKDTFINSKLRLEVYKFPDSVWVDGNYIHSSYTYINSDKYIKNGSAQYSIYPTENIDSIIRAEYKTPRNNGIGKYLNGIKAIKNESKFLESFYDVKETAGYIHPIVMAEILLKTNPDFSNSVVKSLILMEFVYIN